MDVGSLQKITTTDIEAQHIKLSLWFIFSPVHKELSFYTGDMQGLVWGK